MLSLTLLLVAGSVAAPPEDHWAWKPPARPAVPAVKVASPIDAFVKQKLDAAGLSFSPPATRPQLIRRVTFDLVGLPPTPAEVDAFVSDAAPDAYEKVIDRLLASPHYGERWGRHWLDLARYADTNGYEHDEVRPHAWRYRDYVIKSFNDDKPFDRFIVEQLAGDEAFPGDPAARVATGFNLLGPDMTDSADQAQRRLNTLTDMTDTASLVFLGLTVGCARCHDHKFEPITQVDYYRLQAFFAGADFRADLDVATAAERQVHAAAKQEYDQLTQTIRGEIATFDGPHRAALFAAKLAKLPAEAQAAHRTPADQRDGGQLELVSQTANKMTVTDAEIEKRLSADDLTKLKDLRQKLKAFDAKKPAPAPVGVGLANRPGQPPKTHLLERGELGNKAQEVQAGFPAILLPDRKPDAAEVTGGRRLALAKWVASKDNPLTARVVVNRLWQQHFGRGLVPSASDFGLRGEPPTHPELLDWLANDFIDGGWKLKRMHKLMLMSETYRQSSQFRISDFGFRNPDAPRTGPAVFGGLVFNPQSEIQNPKLKDPDNQLFSRMNRLRLEGEAVRDTLLMIGGKLNTTPGGPGVLPAAKDQTRRSVYLFVRRNLRHPFLEAFDLPDSNLSCPKRERSTTAPQALALLNAPEAADAAKALAGRLTGSEAERVETAYRLTLGRLPSAKERERAAAFLTASPFAELCRALMNLNEFVYVD